MVFVAERDGLPTRDTSLGHIRRASDGNHHPADSGENKNETEDAQPSDRVSTAVEGPAHRW
jgi:hypothetical protein